MGTFIPESSFSNIKIRVLSAKIRNPPLFKTVTTFLNGHDTRGKKIRTRSEDGYSYKFNLDFVHKYALI